MVPPFIALTAACSAYYANAVTTRARARSATSRWCDDLRRVSFVGPLDVLHRLVVEADHQLARLAHGDR